MVRTTILGNLQFVPGCQATHHAWFVLSSSSPFWDAESLPYTTIDQQRILEVFNLIELEVSPQVVDLS